MSACPGYLSIIVIDKTSTIDDQLFNYDLLVSCPFPDFNASFFFPNPGGEGPRTFEVQLHDTKHLHRFHVTSDDGPRSSCSPGTLKDTQVLGNVEGPAAQSAHPVPVGVAFVAAACSLVIYVVASLTRRSLRGCGKPAQSGNEAPITESGIPRNDTSRGRVECPQRGRSSCGDRVKRLLLVSYVLLRLLYNVLFAFSAVYVLFTVCLERHLEKLERSLQQNSTLTEILHRRLAFEAAEQLRHSLTRSCCDPVEVVTIFLKPQSSTEVLATSPMSSSMAWNKNLVNYGDELRRFLAEFRKIFESQLDRVMRNFSRVLRSSLRNNWLVFPQSLFNETLVPESAVSGVVEPSGTWEVDFALFLGIAEAESVEEWRREIWNRFEAFGFSFRLLQTTVVGNTSTPTLTRYH